MISLTGSNRRTPSGGNNVNASSIGATLLDRVQLLNCFCEPRQASRIVKGRNATNVVHSVAEFGTRTELSRVLPFLENMPYAIVNQFADTFTLAS